MGVPLLRVALMQERGEVAHGFTTRHGGVSTGGRESLHLAVKDGDDPVEIVENWRRATAALGGSPERLVLLDQVHGRAVVQVGEATGPDRTAGPADAVITERSDLILAVRTADCVPVLFAAPGAVGAAHAGWRGVVAGVVEATVQRLCRLAGCNPDSVIAAIGPHAGVGAYEVGPDVIDALVGAGLPRSAVSWMGPGGREHANLEAAVRLQLERAGVGHIGCVGACTLTDGRFFSHRRDGDGTGRMAAMITRKSP